MRLALALCLAAAPACADTLVTPATITTVTVFPEGALVERQIIVDLPAGEHVLLVPNVGSSRDPAVIRRAEGLVVASMTVAKSRPPATGDTRSAIIRAAEAEVERFELALAAREAEVADIRARAEAEDARIAFFGRIEAPDNADAEALTARGNQVAEEVLAARLAASAARAEAQAAERALKSDRTALAEARKALAAVWRDAPGLTEPDDRLDGGIAPLLLDETSRPPGVLTLSVTKDQAGLATLELATFDARARWTPNYTLHLSRGGTPTLTIERAVLVEQETGEDWLDVDIAFSTAAPGRWLTSSRLWGDLERIISEAELQRRLAEQQAAEERGMGGIAPVVIEPQVIIEGDGAPSISGVAVQSGTTLIYRYPRKVDLRSGADLVQLSLSNLSVTPKVFAEGTPWLDNTAFLVAQFTNDTGEVLLGGPALFWLDGALVGNATIDQVAAGAETRIGFGPIRGLTLKRVVPDRIEGDRGVFSSSTEKSETAVITARNLTGEAWPVRLLDRVPYSEQEDLVIEWSATPPPTETDVDGQRGILAWEFDLPAGETREIRLQHTLRWPSGFVLE